MKNIIMLLITSMFLAGTASAALVIPEASPEVSIWDLYNQFYPGSSATQANIGSYENDVAISNGLYTQVGISQIAWVARYAGDASALYTYTSGNAASTTLMTFVPPVPDGNFIDLSKNQYLANVPGETPDVFGFSLLDITTGEQWYTQKELNQPPVGDKYHFLVLNGTDNKLLVGVEDRSTGDWDYNDFVFEFSNLQPVETNPVPEPATMALFGMGLAGLGVLRKKQLKA